MSSSHYWQRCLAAFNVLASADATSCFWLCFFLQSLEERSFTLKEAAEWVYNQLFGKDSVERKVRQIVEDGVVEVSGRYPGKPSSPHDQACLWPTNEIQGADVHELYVNLANNV